MIDQIDTSIESRRYEPPTEETPTGTWFEGVGAAWDLADIEYGEGFAVQGREKVVKTFPDYKENQKYYDRFIDNSDWLKPSEMEDTNRAFVEQAIDNGRFTLDANGNVVDSKKTWASGFMVDYDLVKGALLARQMGYSKDVEKAAYQEIVNEEKARLSGLAEDNTFTQSALGVVGSFVTRPEFAKEVAASPAKVMGTTILGGAVKAFGAEFMAAAVGEFDRETKFQKHKAMMDEEYTLWDSTLNILQNSTFAGVFRAGGSAISDKWLLRGIKEEVEKSAKLEAEIMKMEGKADITDKAQRLAIDGLDRETLNRFVRREEYKLTQDTNLHIDAAFKAEHDINKGEKVDVEQHTDIDGDEKFGTKDVEETSLEAEVKQNYSNVEEAEQQIIREVDEVPPLKDLEDDVFEGRASEAEAKAEIEAAELGDELAEIEAEIAARQNIDTGSDEYGKMIEEMEAGQQTDTRFKAKTMTVNGVDIPKTEFDLIQKYKANRKWNRENPHAKREIPQAQKDAVYKYDTIVDDLDDVEFKEGDVVNTVFAKGGDNLGAGLIAGIEQDEEGNITFDPEKFILGLGGYTAAKAFITNSTIQQELKDYAIRQLDEFEASRAGKAITGKQEIFAGGKATGFKEAQAKGKTFSDTADKLERFWIDDADAKMLPIGEDKVSYRIDEVIDHPELFKNYPEIAGLRVSIGKSSYFSPQLKHIKIHKLDSADADVIKAHEAKEQSIYDKYEKMAGDGELTPKQEADAEKELNSLYDEIRSKLTDKKVFNKSVLLHEIQHAIQEVEGFAKGGSAKQFDKSLDEETINLMTKNLGEAIFLKELSLKYRIDIKDMKFRKGTYEHDVLQNKDAVRIAKNNDIEWMNKEYSDLTESSHSKYQRLAGEQESRAVEAKLKHPELTPYEALKKEEGLVKKPIIKMESSISMSDNLEDVLTEFKDKYKDAGVKNYVYENSSGEITLSSIQVEKSERNKGIGTKYMKELIGIADKMGKIIVLSPSSDFGGSKTRLNKFYKGFGFVKNKDYRFRETMIRHPKETK